MTDAPSTPTFEYDVCLSFAGEQRSYVQSVAESLRNRGIKVFYDDFEVANLWGKDLYTYLDDIYQNRARYCVVFISEDYARKAWTAHERRSVQARDIGETTEYILPVRFDDSQVPGFRSTIGYIDLREKQPFELAELIIQKLQVTEDRNFANDDELKGITYGVPRSPAELDHLIEVKPIAWEYRLFAGALFQEMAKIENKWRDHQIGWSPKQGNPVPETDAIATFQRFLKEIGASAKIINTLFSKERQEAAFGPPGAQGNPEDIQYIASRSVGMYESFLDSATYLRGLRVPDNYERAFELAARTVNRPAQDVRDFVDHVVQEMDKIPEWSKTPNRTRLTLEMKFTLTIDDSAMEAALNEFKRVNQRRQF